MNALFSLLGGELCRNLVMALADSRHPVTATGGQKEPVVLRIVIRERSDLKPQKPQEN